MADNQKPTNRPEKANVEPTAVKGGLSVPPPPPQLLQGLPGQEQRGLQVPLPPPALLKPAAQVDSGQPASSGQSPQSAPPPAAAAPSDGGKQ
ncbi:MAG: hypothetical protein KF893_05000 [Caldilineaceae bacterium]|nr:hypothetical protein [Caldilineaceae bacterium]